MAVPKRKVSKARRDKRRSSVWKLDLPGITKCPKCGKDIVARKSKKGRVFYGCSGYPECTQSYWNKPIDRKCPKCGELLVEKKSKDAKYACSNSECDYKE